MAIEWDDEQRARVKAVLSKYGVTSQRCETAAWLLLPIGRARDPLAEVWQLRPLVGRYIVPKLFFAKPWFHHFTVEVEAHCVDALTGSMGTARAEYLKQHWYDGDAIAWEVKKEEPHEPW